MSRALIVVDVNNFFLQDAPSDLARKIAEHIEAAQYEAVAFPVFKNEPGSNFENSLNWTKCSSDEDAALPPELKKWATDDNVFRRATYSAFADTDLEEYLRRHKIKELTLCGIDTDACVLATAFSAFDLGFKVHVNFELTFSTNGMEEEARSIIEKSIVPQDKKNG